MKLSSRHIIPLMLVCVMLTGLVSSCQRKPLYLAQRGTLDINVSVYDIQLELLWGVSWKTDWQYLWDESLYGYIGYTEPSGVRANVYTINEDYHRSKYTTRNFSTNGGRVSLTTNNTYDMMFHNNDTEYILYATDDSTYYYATTRSSPLAPASVCSGAVTLRICGRDLKWQGRLRLWWMKCESSP